MRGIAMIGTVVNDRYEIVSELGEGGMATVYCAFDRRLQREVALKILHPHIAKHNEFRQRFQQEAAIAAKLVHPNIVQIHDYGTSEDGRTFIVSELVRGKDFHQRQVERLKEHGRPFAAIFSVMVCEEILKALEAAHSQNFIHRDVKPDNVMMTEDGQVKLTDFGIAKNISTSMTVGSQFLGSPVYASPEQVQAKDVDFRSDLFSVGVMLYESITGKLPFTGQNAPEVMLKIAQGHYPSPLELEPTLATELVKIITTAMQNQKENRYSSTTVMIKAIRDFLQSRGINNSRAGLEAYFLSPENFLAVHDRTTVSSEEMQTESPKPQIRIKPAAGSKVPQRTEFESENTKLNRKNREVIQPSSNNQRKQNLGGGTPSTDRRSRNYHLTIQGVPSERQKPRTEGSLPIGHLTKEQAKRRTYGVPSPTESRWFVGTVATLALIVAIVLIILASAKWDLPHQNQLAVSLPTAKVTTPAQAKVEVPIPTISINTAREPQRGMTGRSNPEAAPPSLPQETKRNPVVAKPFEKKTNKETAPKMVAILATPRPPTPSQPAVNVPSLRPSAFALSTGKITLQSIPPGAQIYVDDKLIGSTTSDAKPTSFELKSGPHTVRVAAPNQTGAKFGPVERKIFVDPGRLTSLGVLRLTPYRTLTISIAGPGVIVRVNGDPYPLQGKPLSLNLPEGRVEIRARAINGKSLERSVLLKGENFTLSASLE